MESLGSHGGKISVSFSIIYGSNNVIRGNNNKVYGDNNIIIGDNNYSYGHNNIAHGYNNERVEIGECLSPKEKRNRQISLDVRCNPPKEITRQGSILRRKSRKSLHVDRSSGECSGLAAVARKTVLPEFELGDITSNDENSCIICAERKRNTTCIPCGHIIYCVSCTYNMSVKQPLIQCSVCRVAVDRIMRVYI